MLDTPEYPVVGGHGAGCSAGNVCGTVFFFGGVLRHRDFMPCWKHWHPYICLCDSVLQAACPATTKYSCLTVVTKCCWVAGTNDCHFNEEDVGKRLVQF